MYPSVRQRPADLPPDEPMWTTPFRWFSVGRNVVLLGVTSLFTDISSEMVTAVLPLYLTLQLRFTPIQFGAVDGLAQGATAVALLAGALIADRHRRYKEVAGAGYGLSALCKLGLLASGRAWAPTTAVLYLDRTGKGVRTAPRDALISLSALPRRLGTAFGVHRALDTVGALLGPVLAFGILRVAQDGFNAIFVVSFCFALIGLSVLALFVENRGPADSREPDKSNDARVHVSLRAALGLLRLADYRVLWIAGTALAVLSVSDAFVYLTFQRRSSFNTEWFPLLYVGTALVYLLLAVPLGRMADRVGRARVFVAGQVMLVGVYAVLLIPKPGLASLGLMLALLGVYYAATDGVLMALASAKVPAGLRTSGLALLSTAIAIARLVASVAFGALWGWRGPAYALEAFSIGLAGSIVIVALLLRKELMPHESRPQTPAGA